MLKLLVLLPIIFAKKTPYKFANRQELDSALDKCLQKDKTFKTCIGPNNVHIGNFVEIKKTDVGEGTKINHLSYIGDSSLGKNINIGAGTITCNYDGAHKHHTIIEDDVFIGSDTQLVAPVTIKKGATVGAGTTVIRDVETGELIHNKIEHTNVKNWKRPVKK